MKSPPGMRDGVGSERLAPRRASASLASLLSAEITVPRGSVELPDVENRSVAIGCFVDIFGREENSRGLLDFRAGRACLAASVTADAGAYC